MPEDPPFGQCEECLNQAVLYDVILRGKTKQLCKRCLNATGAIEIKKPKKITPKQERRTVREILMRMSGLDKQELPHLKEGISQSSEPEITLDDLVERKRQREAQESQQPEQPAQPESKEKKPIESPKDLDFSITSAKRIRISDLLRLKRRRDAQKQQQQIDEHMQKKEQEIPQEKHEADQPAQAEQVEPTEQQVEQQASVEHQTKSEKF